MERNIEYIQLFMEYESDDMPMVYFYEVDVNDDRFALRAIEIFVDRTVKFYNDLYCDVVEVCPIPTVDELRQHRTNATIRIIQQVPNKNCG